MTAFDNVDARKTTEITSIVGNYYDKLMLDRITRGGRIWRDDSQVARLWVNKYWAITDARIGVYVSVNRLVAGGGGVDLPLPGERET